MSSAADQLVQVRNVLAALAGDAGHDLGRRAHRELMHAYHHLENADGHRYPWPPPEPATITDPHTELTHLQADLQALLEHTTRLRLQPLELALAARRVAIAHELTT